MNIQIYGTKKCNDSKKAERYFKERNIKFQFIDMKEKERKTVYSRISAGDMENMAVKLTWKESHGSAAYIPCGNAYCTNANCANCETQMQLQVENKIARGEEMTEAEKKWQRTM